MGGDAPTVPKKKEKGQKTFGFPIKDFGNDEWCGCLIKALRHDGKNYEGALPPYNPRKNKKHKKQILLVGKAPPVNLEKQRWEKHPSVPTALLPSRYREEEQPTV